MTKLFFHQRELKTIFNLLGDTENALTGSLGWALSKSDRLCSRLLSAVFHNRQVGQVQGVRLQQFGEDKGYTDVEIIAKNAHAIIEAKRGWNLPTQKQLERYAKRLQGDNVTLVVLAECSPEYTHGKLPERVKHVPVEYLSWKRVAGIVGECHSRARHVERHLLGELEQYLRGVMNMQDAESNLVYVVALGSGRPNWSSLPWIEFVTKRRCYFHPLGGNGWPTVPPTYLAFRYEGRLQSIHHVDGYDVVEDLSEHVSEIDSKKWKLHHLPHILYRLGPPIYPSREVRTGRIYRNGRVWTAFDLLFTSKTVSDARDRTNKRLGK